MLKTALTLFFLATGSPTGAKAPAQTTLKSVTLEYRLAPGEKAPAVVSLSPVYRPDANEKTMLLKPVAE